MLKKIVPKNARGFFCVLRYKKACQKKRGEAGSCKKGRSKKGTSKKGTSEKSTSEASEPLGLGLSSPGDGPNALSSIQSGNDPRITLIPLVFE